VNAAVNGFDVVVAGAGVIGLAIAWRAACDGARVAVCDSDPGRGASWVAAGLLAPITEVHYGEELLLKLNLASAARWPSFAAELEDASGMSVGLRVEGTLVVAVDADDMRSLDELAGFQRSLGLGVERLGSREVRRLEPNLSPRTRGALFVASDHHVDNRRVVSALRLAATRAGVVCVPRAVTSITVQPGTNRASGVLLDDHSPIGAGTVVVAAGAASASISGLPAEAQLPVRPVKGQIIRLHVGADGPLLTRAVRGVVHNIPVYIVPRHDGEIVVGATSEEQGFDISTTAGAALDLLAAAATLVPDLREARLDEIRAGSRPTTPDNGPVLGRCAVSGVVWATGHYRNGILLTPVTADAIGGVLRGLPLPPEAAPFTLDRFYCEAT
jgi:glycine oxidase